MYKFTKNWFESNARKIWDNICPKLNIRAALEVGSFEGASTCYLVEVAGSKQDLEIHCVDTWRGGEEHTNEDMTAVERRFQANLEHAIGKSSCAVNLHVHIGESDYELAKLLTEGYSEYFDFIYIDGSHIAKDVICDAVLSFRLLKPGGVIIFDDYLWTSGGRSSDLLRRPKLGIDAFTTIYSREIRILNTPVQQVCCQKNRMQ